MPSFWTIALLTIISHTSFSQEYSYAHYDIAEGLAGSTAYCITQDKDRIYLGRHGNGPEPVRWDPF